MAVLRGKQKPRQAVSQAGTVSQARKFHSSGRQLRYSPCMPRASEYNPGFHAFHVCLILKTQAHTHKNALTGLDYVICVCIF